MRAIDLPISALLSYQRVGYFLVTRYTREVLNSVKERGGLITEVINELHGFVRDFPSGDTCGQRENDVTGEAPT